MLMVFEFQLPSGEIISHRVYKNAGNRDVVNIRHTDPAVFIEDILGLPIPGSVSVSGGSITQVLELFAIKLWSSLAGNPSSIWLGRDGVRYFVGYTCDSGDFYSTAVEYIEHCNII